MAKNFNPEALVDAKRENRKESKKFDTTQASDTNEASGIFEKVPGSENKESENAGEKTTEKNTEQANAFTMPPPAPEPVHDEFKQRYDEYFKKMGGVVAGDIVIGLIDDLKTNFLYLYAKKNGIEVEKDALKMDDKSRGFAAFLVDEAVKNNFFTWIKKYPLLAALGVIVISGGSTFLMLTMLKKSTDESRKKDDQLAKMKKENEDLVEKLKKERQQTNRDAAQTVKDLYEQELSSDPDLKEFIKKV